MFPHNSHLLYHRWRQLWQRLLTGWLVLLIAAGALLPSTAQAQTPVAAPAFSVVRGFYSSPFSLTLTSPTAGATIRYTLDGSTPTTTTGTVYNGAITINRTVAVRALAYLDDTNKSPVVTHTYLFLAQVRSQSDTPLPGWPSFFAPNDSNGPYPADYEMDPDILNHANYRDRYNGAMLSLPTISLVTDLPNLWDTNIGIYYNMEEKDGDPGSRPDPLNTQWERPLSIEWINPDGSTGFALNAGIRIHGQSSRRPYRTPKKSLRIVFRSRYGAGQLSYPLYNYSDPVNQFERLVIRNVGNRHWAYYDRDQRRETDYINDEWSRRTWLQMGHLSAHGTFAHVYIDGLYWGIYNVVERLDERFLRINRGGLDTDYDLISVDEDLGNIVVADAGTLDAYNALLATLAGTSSVSNATYQSVLTQMDINDFADYLLHTHFIGKTDWPYHNWNAFRKRVGDDTKFHFMTWDDDTGLNKVDQAFDQTNSAIDTPETPSWMFVRLVTNAEFRQLLADRMFKHVISADGVLAPTNCDVVYRQLAGIIDQAVIGESARWGDYARDKYHWEAQAKAWPAYLYSRDLDPNDPINSTKNTGSLTAANKKSWVTVRDQKLANYCPNRGSNLVSQYVSKGYYQTSVKPPTYSKLGGQVSSGFVLTIANTPNSSSGDIYYTTDGSDPRAFGGGNGASALLGGDNASVTINGNTTVKARVKNGSVWSPLMDYAFTTSGTGNQPPTVSISSPATGASFAVGSSVPIQVIASDSDGTVAQVAMTANGAAICTDTSAPYQCTWIPASAGNVSLVATAIDNNGASATSTAVNVTITGGGGEGAFQEQGGTVVMEAENYESKIARSSHDWQAQTSPAGYSGASAMIALPNNNTNLQTNVPTTSPEMRYQVNVATTGTYNVWLRVLGATGSDDSLHFGGDGSLVGSPSVAGTAWFWKKVGTLSLGTAGVHSVHIWMREDGTLLDKLLLTTGSTTPSGVGPAESPRGGGGTNQRPMVSITAPANGASYPLGTALTIEATASDSDGNVTQVAFQVNGSTLCNDNAAPYECVWSPATAANYSLTAIATDNQGTSTTSTAVNVTITGGGGGDNPFLEQGGTLVMEAENFHSKVGRSAHEWQAAIALSGFSGAGAMIALPNVNTNLQSNIQTSSPEMIYQASFSTLGTYNLWVRAVGPNGSDDSLHIGVDGVLRASPSVTGSSWFWKKVGTANITTAGTHTIHIWMREDGTPLDKLLLTTAATTPSGTGPAESPRSAAPLGQMPILEQMVIVQETPAEEGLGRALIDLPEVTLVAPVESTLTANQPIDLAALFPLDETVSDPAAWVLTFLANESPIAGCEALALNAVCSWTPTPGEVQLQVVAYNAGVEAVSTTEYVVVMEGEARAQRVYLPIINQ